MTHVRLGVLGVLFLAFWLAPAGGSLAADEGGRPRIAPGPLAIMVKSGKDTKPISGVYVRIGGRLAATDAAGKVIFEGLPSGRHKLVIEHYGYDRLAQDINLPDGKRDAINLSLTPVEMVMLGGKVVAAGHGGALAGAQIALLPVAVPASCQGQYDFATAWDGTFQVIQIPPGKYSAQVSTAGCEAKTFDLVVTPKMPAVQWELARTFQPAQLTVTLKDSVSGKSVAGAKVTLAEAGTVGRIATTSSDAEGKVVFKDLKVGTLNWADAKGNLDISRRSVTVQAEAAGYEPNIINVSLLDAAIASVSLNPTTKIAGDGENNTLATAMAIRTGTPIEFTIPNVGVKRFYKFRVDYPSLVRLAIGPKNPIQTYMFLMDSKGKVLRDSASEVDKDNVLNAGGLPIGDYYVHVEEWFNNNASPKPLTFTVTLTPGPDAHEPNDAPAAARLLRVGEEVRGCILPRGEADWFRFEVQRPCHVRVTMPAHPNQRWLAIRDSTGRSLAEAAAEGKAPLELVVVLGRGAYLLDVHEWFDNDEFVEPYTLRLEQIEDDAIDDPAYAAGRPRALRELKLGGLVGNTIFPTGDNDTYAVSIPSAGRFHLQFISVTQLNAFVFSPAGAVLASGAVEARNMGHASCDLGGPTTLFVRMHEWFDNDCSPWPYVISTWFEPCDEMELAGRNDTPQTATPIELNELVRGSFMPLGDVDWYSLEVDHPGWLRLDVIGPTQHFLRLRDSKLRVVGETTAELNRPLALEQTVFPGTYFIELHEWFDNDSSPTPYCLTARLRRAEPQERAPLASDPVRTLKPGEGQAFWIDHVADVDRFLFTMPEAGKFTIRIHNPTQTFVLVYDDQTNAKVREQAFEAGVDAKIDLEAKNPTRYRLEVHEWFDNDFSCEPAFIMADPQRS